jgi:hypothetical protein
MKDEKTLRLVEGNSVQDCTLISVTRNNWATNLEGLWTILVHLETTTELKVL